jgi:hypothetical protein
MKLFVFSTIWAHVWVCWVPRMYVEFCYWINIWGLGGYMRTAPDIFIGWYICYFIRPAWQQVVLGGILTLKIAR